MSVAALRPSMATINQQTSQKCGEQRCGLPRSTWPGAWFTASSRPALPARSTTKGDKLDREDAMGAMGRHGRLPQSHRRRLRRWARVKAHHPCVACAYCKLHCLDHAVAMSHDMLQLRGWQRWQLHARHDAERFCGRRRPPLRHLLPGLACWHPSRRWASLSCGTAACLEVRRCCQAADGAV